MRHWPSVLLAILAAPLASQAPIPAAFGLPSAATPAIGPLLTVHEPPFASLRDSVPIVFRLVLISTTGQDAVIRVQEDTSGAVLLVKRFGWKSPDGPYEAQGVFHRALATDRVAYIASAFDYMSFWTYAPEEPCGLDGDWYLIEAASSSGQRAVVSSSCARTAKILADLMVYEATKVLRAP